MSMKSLGEDATVGLRSNFLIVNGHSLRADVLKESKSESLTISPEALEKVLLMGRRAIVTGIENFYEQQVARHPDLTVQRPSIWTAKLGTTAQTDGSNSKVFTDKGYANGGINTSIDEVKPQFHAHWNAVVEAGFLPEVRRTSGARDGGSWLLLRKPTLPQVLEYWFGTPKDVFEDIINTISDNDNALERRNLRWYRMLREQAIDAAVDTVPDTARSREQIGLILSMAAIKSALGDAVGYEDELEDAFTCMDNDTRMDASTIRAVENSTFDMHSL